MHTPSPIRLKGPDKVMLLRTKSILRKLAAGNKKSAKSVIRISCSSQRIQGGRYSAKIRTKKPVCYANVIMG